MTNTTATKSGLKFSRHYTTGSYYYEDIVWKKFTAKITEPDGRVVFEMKDLEAPDFWSQLAVDIAASKYFRKAGLPIGCSPNGMETSVKQLVERVAGAIQAQGARQGYFGSNADELIFGDELRYILIHQIAAFNSPVWFNVGLFEEYGITGNATGNWAVDLATGIASRVPDAYSRPQASACFIQTVDDNIEDIGQGICREMLVFRGGSGSGINYSNIRGENEPLSGGGKSSGVMSFLEVYDKSAGAIKSGGTTRRAARLALLNADHPDIEAFIEWKVKEEKKVAALVAAGYSSDFNGEAYKTVSGQNANNSVRATDEFMKAVVEDKEWNTIWRTNGKVAKTYRAKDLMRKIATAAWQCADPGMLFHTTINNWNPTPKSASIDAANPCVEYHFIPNSACNLLSINLVRMIDGKHFKVPAFRHVIDICITAMDLLVDMASYPTKEIAENSHKFRPLGIGFANIGALLMRWGLPYDSEEGRQVAGAITALLTGRAYRQSVEIAKVKGPFKEFAKNKDDFMLVMEKHGYALEKLSKQTNHDIVSSALVDWTMVCSYGGKYGIRNAQASNIAPTGTIGLLMDCDTTGIEPDYSLVKYKKLAGGGSFKIVNQSVNAALDNLQYSETVRNRIIEHIKATDTIEGSEIKPEHLAVFDCASRCGPKSTRSIRPRAHVEMLAAVQPFLSGASSKTVNCPAETTVEEIEQLYIDAWKMGIKALAIYRDGSKLCAILSTKKEEPVATSVTTTTTVNVSNAKEIKKVDVPKRRRLHTRRQGTTQEARIGGNKIFLRTGEYQDGKIGELFIDMHKEGATTRSLLNAFSIAVSLGLQYGVPLDEFVEAFIGMKFEPKGVVRHDDKIKVASSIMDYVFRNLGIHYLNRSELSNVKVEDKKVEQAVAAELGVSGLAEAKTDGNTCETCGNLTMKAGACNVCTTCGTTTGCG